MKINSIVQLFLILINLSICIDTSSAQNIDPVSPNKILIRQITFEGNKRTKPQRILREMEIKVGDSLTLNQIKRKLEESKNRIINTGLFTEVNTNLYFDEENYRNISIAITVKEGLYFIPIPIIELATRNLNIWITEYNSDIKFLNLGMYLKMKNLTGNADDLYILGQGGFDRKFSLKYTSPYFDEARKWNFEFNTYLNSNKEISYIDDNREPILVSNNNEFLQHRLESSFSTNYRPNYTNFFSFRLGYFYQQISDELFREIPHFLNGELEQHYSSIEASYTLEKRNNRYLASQGFFGKIIVQKNGLTPKEDFQAWNIRTDLHIHDDLGKGWTWNHSFIYRALLPDQQYPYYNLYRLGGDTEYVRGYENEQIEGNQILIGKTGIMKRIFDRPIKFGKIMPFNNYKSMDTKIYLSVDLNVGKVWDRYYFTHELNNKVLIGGGLGIKFLMYHQLGIIFEASMTKEKKFGLFFHINDTL